MTINKEQPVSDADANMLSHPYSAAIEAGAKVLRQFRDTNLDLYTDKEIAWLVFCAMRAEDPSAKAAPHHLEQQQAAGWDGWDVVERACVAFIEQIEAEMRALPEMFGKMSEDRQGFYCERVTDEQRDAVRRSMAAALASSGVQRMRTALEAVEGAMLRGGDGAIGDFGWNITNLNNARPLIRIALQEEGDKP